MIMIIVKMIIKMIITNTQFIFSVKFEYINTNEFSDDSDSN